jgi:hypothetical protein
MAAAPEVTRVGPGPGLPAAPSLPSAALARLPETAGQADPFWRLAAAFLVGYPPATARAYLSDLRAWARWCGEHGIHPLTARRHHVDHWARHLAAAPQPATGRPAAAATIARRRRGYRPALNRTGAAGPLLPRHVYPQFGFGIDDEVPADVDGDVLDVAGEPERARVVGGDR